MLSSSSVGKKGSHCSTKLCTPVWFSIDSKGHLQACKKGKAEKLRKIAGNCDKLRKIAQNCEKFAKWRKIAGKLRTSIPPPPLLRGFAHHGVRFEILLGSCPRHKMCLWLPGFLLYRL